MPNVTTYIRKDDMELWLACPNKAELIHNALNMRETYLELPPKQKDQVKKHIVSMPSEPDDVTFDDLSLHDKAVVTLQDRNISLPKSKFLNGVCKIHDVPLDSRGKCLQKGCKYA